MAQDPEQDLINQHHRMIQIGASLEVSRMSGAFRSTGPFAVGPGFCHRPR